MKEKISTAWTSDLKELQKFSDNKKSGAALDDTNELAHFFEINLISLLQTNLIV